MFANDRKDTKRNKGIGNMADRKKCRKCKVHHLKTSFVDSSGERNPKGAFCRSCFNEREVEMRASARKERIADLEKLKVIYGEFWIFYTSPHTFPERLATEREHCPYCGTKLNLVYDPGLKSQQKAHIEHMDPLELGGEDSFRNSIYVCGSCNLKKGSMAFTKWLAQLDSEYANKSRDIYIQKHGFAPEKFIEGEPTERCGGYDARLCWTLSELKEKYPEPEKKALPDNLQSVDFDSDLLNKLTNFILG